MESKSKEEIIRPPFKILPLMLRRFGGLSHIKMLHAFWLQSEDLLIANLARDSFSEFIQNNDKFMAELGREDLKLVKYIDIIDKAAPMEEVMHHIYCRYIRSRQEPIRNKGYTHFMWFEDTTPLMTVNKLLKAAKLAYQEDKPKLLIKYESENKYPWEGVAFTFGFNFLTDEMVKLDTDEEYNVILR